jgi:DNA-binding response OmpR family regulator
MKDTSVLYIEDNEDYIEFMERSLKKVNSELSLEVINDGKKAIEFFENVSEEDSLPKLILMDIKLPGCSGLEILSSIRKKTATKYIPVIMFSSSENAKDMMQASENGANAYIVKPIGLSSLTATLKSLCDFWLIHNKPIEKFAA